MSVYFMSDGARVKIGHSGNTRSRLSNCQVSNAKDVEILFVIDGDREVESGYHDRFANYKCRGEWYDIKGDLKDFILRKTLSDPIVEPEYSRRIRERNYLRNRYYWGHYIHSGIAYSFSSELGDNDLKTLIKDLVEIMSSEIPDWRNGGVYIQRDDHGSGKEFSDSAKMLTIDLMSGPVSENEFAEKFVPDDIEIVSVWSVQDRKDTELESFYDFVDNSLDL